MDASERRVTVVGDDDRTAELRRVIGGIAGTAADAPPPATTAVDPSESDDAALVVAVGREALRGVVAAAPSGTVIPVGEGRLALDDDRAKQFLRRAVDANDDGTAIHSSAPSDAGSPPPDADDDLAAAFASTDGVCCVSHPVLAVNGASSSRRAALDVAFVTDAPARISEFAVGFASGTDAMFRADGVAIATPLGSDGYANAAGAPIVEPGGGLAVVPIAPFRTQTDSWIAAAELTVTVERESEPVALIVDGVKLGLVDPNRPIAIEAVDQVDLAVSTPRAERDDRKHSNNS
ncbi:ATP-NAD kinase [Halorubrum laminariae]|uniref:ATP-NAD kinase n=1 Tax=Halorubrum laminariae TaxID=1433523 RepID=A0ABD6C3D8_9EURY|nr:ATP-NAD kinase [Halorubrum laminariae]